MPRVLTLPIAVSLFGLSVAAALLPAEAQTRNLVPVAPVAAALTQAGLPAEPAQIDLPEPLSTVTLHENFHVTAAELLPDGRLRVHLVCGKGDGCRPFAAIVRPKSSAEGLRGLIALQAHLQSAKQANSAAATTRLLAGQRVTLVLEDSHMRITVPVLAIDSGAAGTEVRVSSLDRKQVFHGVVADPFTVRGILP
jgi:hypothetical protein